MTSPHTPDDRDAKLEPGDPFRHFEKCHHGIPLIRGAACIQCSIEWHAACLTINAKRVKRHIEALLALTDPDHPIPPQVLHLLGDRDAKLSSALDEPEQRP